MTEWNKRELSYNEAHNWLMSIFHKTRLNDNLSVPPNVVYALLYKKPIVGRNVNDLWEFPYND